MTARYDVIIRGGTVVDGTGAAPRQADGAARETIDARGLPVTPGLPGRLVRGRQEVPAAVLEAA